MTRTAVTIPNAPVPAGPYSDGVVVGGSSSPPVSARRTRPPAR